MAFANRTLRALLLAGAVALSLPTTGFTQERVGIVTTVEGTATVARVALPQPQPLRFKDDVLLHDRITTGERSVVRVLLGGKATVTARERSVVTITEVPGRSTVELDAGRISVAVSKGLMKPGEVIEIKTPNAVSAIRGTVVVAEVVWGESVRSTITVLRGLVDVTRLDRVTRHRVGAAVDVSRLQSATVIGSQPVPTPRTITSEDARRLTSEFRVIPSTAPSADSGAVQVALRQAALDSESLVSAARAKGNSGSGGSRDGKSESAGDGKDAKKSKGANGTGAGASVSVAMPSADSVVKPSNAVPSPETSIIVASPQRTGRK